MYPTLSVEEAETAPPSLAQQRQKSKKRWQLAIATIYCSRALNSLAKNKLTSRITRSLSYIAIQVEPAAEEFGIDQTTLSELVQEQNLDQLTSLGGVEGVTKALRSSVKNGIDGDNSDILNRQKAFGSYKQEKPRQKTLFSLLLKAFKDPIIILLVVCAAFSLGFGIRKHGLSKGWSDGGSILLAVSTVTGVACISNMWTSRQFDKLSRINDNTNVDVVRNGWRQQVSIAQVVVGDVLCLKSGDRVPADGLILNSHSLQVIQSNLMDSMQVNCSQHPFLHLGSMVAEGSVRMLVVSTQGRMLSRKWQDSQDKTPLQARLNEVKSATCAVGLSVALLLSVILLIRYFMGKMENGCVHAKTEFLDLVRDVVGILATPIAMAAGAVPDGLPLALAITLAYSMKRMSDNGAVVRRRSACETISSATAICTKLNQMTVTKVWIGQESVEEGAASLVAPNITELLHQGIAFNTTQPPSKASSFFWTPTEKALMCWATQEMGMNKKELEESCSILYSEAFDSVKTRSGFLMRKSCDNTIHVHWKGTPEDILAMCSQYYDISGTIKAIDYGARMRLKSIVQVMAADGLRCIALAHKNSSRIPYEYGISPGQVLDESHLVLVALIGVKDPCEPGFEKAVAACLNAGLHVKMMTKDCTSIARAIATECGILKPNQRTDFEVVEGIQFQNCSPEERMAMVDEIRVMSGASPRAMLLMVQCLKQRGHVVAFSSGDTMDAAVLREADIGIAMGSQATDTAKESSDMVMLDDRLVQIVNVLKWGRTMHNHIQIFTQFQLTASITSLVIDFVTLVSANKPPTIKIVAAISSGEVPFAALQLLWLKLIVGPLAALALAVGQPSKEIMKHPVDKKALITNIMWRNILAQAIYHTAILLILQFKGKAIFGVDGKVKDTLIFNTLVLCQVFNKFNAREPKKMNIFKKIHRNKLFLGIIAVVIALQVVMVEFLKQFAGTERLNWQQWGASICIAASSWPFAWYVKWLPVPKKPFLSYLKCKK